MSSLAPHLDSRRLSEHLPVPSKDDHSYTDKLPPSRILATNATYICVRDMPQHSLNEKTVLDHGRRDTLHESRIFTTRLSHRLIPTASPYRTTRMSLVCSAKFSQQVVHIRLRPRAQPKPWCHHNTHTCVATLEAPARILMLQVQSTATSELEFTRNTDVLVHCKCATAFASFC